MNKEIKYAAGGIVWKKIAGEYKMAVVYRERHGGQWSLPKGGLKEHESWTEAAQREVEEEVGVKTQIIQYADSIDYQTNGTPKLVSFWHMSVIGNSSKARDTEVVKIKWLSPDEALNLVHYKEQKRIISELQFPQTSFAGRFKGSAQILRFKNLFLSFFSNSSRHERLEGDLNTFRVELEYTIRKSVQDEAVPAWAITARDLMSKAVHELEQENIDIAWKLYHAARRVHLYGLTEDEVKQRAGIFRIEAAKLNEWRRKATYKLLGDTDHPVRDLNKDTLVMAARIRDEHYNNDYYKNRLVRDVFVSLLILTIIVTAGIVFYFGTVDISNFIQRNDAGEVRSVELVRMVTGVLLFGLLGGCISSIFYIRDSSKITRVPEIINNRNVTFMRVFVGGASALVIFIFLQSGLTGIFNESIDLRPDNPFTYFAVSFVAGFTERLLLKAISSLIGKE